MIQYILTIMTRLALVLILLSALAHATWNFLLKRATNQEVFTWWLRVVMSILLLPFALTLFWQSSFTHLGLYFIVGRSLLDIIYFMLLGRSYASGDLSLTYPIARGVGPALTPILGVLVLNETVEPQAIVGIVSVVLGIYTLYWGRRLSQILTDPLKFLRERSTRYALLTGVVIAVYSVWDKVAIELVNPFLYMYLFSFVSAVLFTPYAIKKHGRRVLLAEWRISSKGIIAAAILSFLAYGMILTALQFSRVSYIAPAREISIVVGVLLGIIVLKESFGRSRLIGSCLIVAGLTLIAVAP